LLLCCCCCTLALIGSYALTDGFRNMPSSYLPWGMLPLT
jgi:hypothetical protein